MKLLIALLFVMLCGTVGAQSFFKPVPKAVAPRGARGILPGAAMAAEPTQNSFRPIINVGSYLIGSPENALLTGGGISYQHLQYNSATDKWSAVWSINALAWGKVVVNNDANTNAFMYGVAVGFLNNMVLVGAATDGKKVYPTAGFGINFNN